MDLIERDIFNNNRHPWEIARRHSILGLLKHNPRDSQYADIGAGDLYCTEGLLAYTDKPIYAVDVNYKPGMPGDKVVLCKDISNVPTGRMDFVLLMDVLEHTEDDLNFLKSITVILKEKGEVIITVPAFQFLFSSHDISLRHFRRYHYKTINHIINACDLEIKENFYFYTFLLFIRYLGKFFNKSERGANAKRHTITSWGFKSNSMVTLFFVKLLELDFLVNRLFGKIGLTIPGLSLCLICQKKSA